MIAEPNLRLLTGKARRAALAALADAIEEARGDGAKLTERLATFPDANVDDLQEAITLVKRRDAERGQRH